MGEGKLCSFIFWECGPRWFLNCSKEELTSGHHDVCSVGAFKGHSGRNAGRSTVNRHPVPVPSKGIPGRLSVEFVNVDGWFTNGDMALGSSAQFLAVAEHWLIPARARSVGHQLRRADCHSVWGPACQYQVSGGHARVGVISLCGATLEYFR